MTSAARASTFPEAEMRMTGTQSTAKLFPRIGSLHHSIATKNLEAQNFFDQGLTLVYAFNFEEAVRSFEQAAELDSHSPMPYWGIALANGPSYNGGVFNSPARTRAAFAAINTAIQLCTDAPENERSYVNALARRFTDSPSVDPWKLARDYSAAMRDLSRRYPDDPDAASLYAESLMDLAPGHLWTFDGKPGENTPEIVSTLEGVLTRWPNHLGANHFYIHTMEASPSPDRALPSAHRLETLAPAAGHLVHMPAHIYFRVGDYAAAVKSCLAAAEVDRNYARETTVPNKSYELAYAEHNLSFLVAAANMDGEFAIAEHAAIELRTRFQTSLPQQHWRESSLAQSLFVLLRFAKWDDILELSPPEENLRGLTFFWHFARGCALTAKGEAQRAQSERDEMERIFKKLDTNELFGMLGSWASLHKLAAAVMDARIAAAHGDMATAITQWRAAVAEQDQVARDDFYRELSSWYYPIRESLAAALFRSGQTNEAEKVFREDLSKNFRNPHSLFGLQLVLVAQRKTVEAKQIESQFETGWKGVDSHLRIESF